LRVDVCRTETRLCRAGGDAGKEECRQVKRLAVIVLFALTLAGAYEYGKRVERISWQQAIQGREGNPHAILAGRIWDRVRGK
jgi:hypothetical protein